MLTSPDQISARLQRVSEGDRQAFDEIYHATSAKLYGTILRIFNDRQQADEILQETYVKVWLHADKFDAAKASPITWLVTIARNTALDELRRQNLNFTDDPEVLDNLEDASAHLLTQLQHAQSASALDNCLGKLEESRSQAVKLAYLDGWSRQDLAKRFEQPVNTIKTWLHRSLKQLKGCLES